MNGTGSLIETLRRSETYQNYERAYAGATGLPITLRAVETWQLPFLGKPHENPFCAVMAEKSHTCGACLQLQQKLTQSAMNKPATVTCVYGLCEIAVPVKRGLETIGFLQTGQVMRRNPTPTSFQRAIEQASKRSVNIDTPKVRHAYFRTPIASQKRLDALTGLLVNFADHLEMKSNQLVMQTAHTDPPVIVKAKQFIRDHYTEELTLTRVSSAVNMSVFYFCKQFHKYTDLKFTEFVSRTRVEKATNLLLNPNVRISEVAYAVGFQSLTHFNRVFRQITGQSPTGYRAKLSGGGR